MYFVIGQTEDYLITKSKILKQLLKQKSEANLLAKFEANLLVKLNEQRGTKVKRTKGLIHS